MAIADQVVALNLIEVSQLTALLREKLNLPADFGTGMMAMAPAGGSPATAPAEEKEEKTSFDLKLESFDAAAKIKVIKEIRSITELGLKEAKELVEGAPAMVKKGLKKEEAEEFKKKLEAVGAKVSLE